MTNIEKINRHKDELLRFAALTEEDIKKIWIQNGEFDADLKNIEYKFDAPLYQKMVFRFRNCNNSPSAFWNQIDPANRQRLLLTCGVYFDEEDVKILDFFAWIKNGLGYYDFDDSDYVYNTRNTNNEIIFFFGLEINQQNSIIKKYNDMINRHNAIKYS